jgi:hypothetical protein
MSEAHSGMVFQRLGAQYFHRTFSVHTTRGKKLSWRQTFNSLCITATEAIDTDLTGAWRALGLACAALALWVGVGERSGGADL